MFCAYRTNSTLVITEVLADIKKLLTGETNVANLGASCDKANPTITSTIAAGWTDADPTGVNTKLVLSAPDLDAVTTKIAVISVPAATWTIQCAETWNTTTHVGTNLSAVGNGSTISLSAVLFLYIWATPRYIYILPNQSAAFGVLLSFGELSRSASLSDYYSIGNAKHLHYCNVTGATGATHFTRAKNNTSVGETLGTASVSTCLGTYLATSNIITPVRQFNETITYTVMPKWLAVSNNTTNYALMSTQVDGYIIVGNTGSTYLDEVTIGGLQYQILAPSGQTAAFLVYKG